MAELVIEAVAFAHAQRTVLSGFGLRLAQGRIGCLLGPSGCGKTTVLRLVAGLARVAAGRIEVGGRTISSPTVHVPPEARRIGLVFQDHALFPHLTVAENVAFGLTGVERARRGERVAGLLAALGLTGRERNYPHELSGGQQQRVALARALAPRPQILLLDEPFSSLDAEMRERLGGELRRLLVEEQVTALLVTHDQHEAFALADEIGVMHDGRIEQWATPYQLYHQPASRFVADFVGQGALVKGVVLDRHHVRMELGVLAGEVPMECVQGCAACERDCHVDILLRPDDVVHDDASPRTARVVHKAFRGADILYTLRLPSGTEVLSLVPSHHNHALGEEIGLRLDVDHVVAFRVDKAPSAQAARLTHPEPAS